MINIQIIFEDNCLLVLDKPSGITVNKADTTKNEITVQEWVEEHLRFKKVEDNDFYNRAGIVHRLDKETSGILIVAKTVECFIKMQEEFKQRIVKKTYIALAHGNIFPPEGTISVPVGRLPWNRKRFGVLAGGKESVTDYKVLAQYSIGVKNIQPLSLVELNPKTGRTHQIRVHLKYINHPIFADPLYAGRKVSRDDRKFLNRVFLHAEKIEFIHPQTGKSMEFESKLPVELNAFLNNLNK